MNRLTRLLTAGLVIVASLNLQSPVPVGAEALTQVGGGPIKPADADRLGDLDPSTPLDLQLVLNLRHRAELDQLIQAQRDPASPRYGHYLSPQQFAATFAPDQASVDAAAGFLRGQGLAVTSVSGNHLLVNARATASVAQRAFSTRLGRYRERISGHEFYASDSAPTLPASIAPLVQSVRGLDNRSVRHHAATVLPRAPGSGPAGGYTPAEIRGGYGLNSGSIAALDGTGQAIALLELDQFDQGHLDTFANQYFGHPLSPPLTRSVDNGASLGGGQIEVELDLEVMQGLAPGAAIKVWEAPNTDQGINDAYAAMVADPHTQVISTSWGLCETGQGQAETNALDSIFAQGAAEGQAFFAASGDSGPYDCRNPADACPSTNPTDNLLAVDSPASDPFVTGAGGTSLLLSPSRSESAWGASCEGGGGGYSVWFSKPSWQSNGKTNPQRGVPDVAFDADPGTGFSIYTTTPRGTGWTVVAGTSAAAPAWAALAAIHNEYACGVDKAGMTSANSQLYAAASATAQPFTDITTGNNGDNGIAVAPYPAGTGWDEATGLGTPKAGTLSSTLAAAVAAGSAPPRVLSVNPASDTPSGGATVTINGCGFRVAGNTPPTVKFGGATSPSVAWLSPFQLSVVVPPHVGGLVDIQVTNPSGSTDTGPGVFRYVATTRGYNILTQSGAIYSFGDANYHGNLLDHGYPGPAVGLAATPDGGGYNILTDFGAIYSFGNANYFGNLLDHGYPGPASALSYTPSGGGYAILTTAGALYTFGDAQYFGNLLDHHYPGTAVSLAYTPTGKGYAILTASGAIYTFGDAQYYGNLLDHGYPGVATSLNMTKSGQGYGILTTGGGLYNFGDAPYFGNLVDHGYPGPAVAIADTP